MSRGVLAVSLVLVWLTLSGVESLSAINFGSYREAHRTVKADLISAVEGNELADGKKLPGSQMERGPFYAPALFCVTSV
jgi:hypothetical protein